MEYVFTTSDTDRAWAAGFWDGEGCVTHGKAEYPMFQLAQAGEEGEALCKKFLSSIGVEGTLKKQKSSNPEWSDYWVARFYGEDKISFALEACRPWLSKTKIKQAENRLSLYRAKKATYVHWRAGQTHCLRGHEYTQESLMIWSDGRRRCRICRRAKDKIKRDKKKELSN